MMDSFVTGSAGFNLSFNNYIQDELETNTPILLINANNITWDSGIIVRDYSVIKTIYSPPLSAPLSKT